MYDLVIRNGTVVDGSGLPRFRADVGIVDGRIAAVTRIRERGKEEIDATGHVVSPGFIDGHTHMDAQIFWDPLGSCSCWHGITTVIMGNCGFSLAPGTSEKRALTVRNLERAEDISASAMDAAIRWDWTTFRQYMEVIDRLPKAINYASNIGHSAMRTHVMGERAFEEEASAADMAAMEAELKDALDAGAIGFTTSMLHTHQTSDDRPVASLKSNWEEIRHLVNAMGKSGHGVFELARDRRARSPDPAIRETSNGPLRALAVESGVPITFGIPPAGNGARDALNLLDSTAAAGGRMFGQTHSRGISQVLSFQGHLPYEHIPEWRELMAMSIPEKRAALAKAEFRKVLVDTASNAAYKSEGVQPSRQPDYRNMHVVLSAVSLNPTVAEVAAQRGVHPVEAILDLALETDFNQLFMQFSDLTKPQTDEEGLVTLKHPRTIMTFSDSGAHVSMIMDSSIHTHLLAYWVRERQAFTLEEAVRMITLAPALAWRIRDRGLVREGCIADLNIFDPEKIAPEMPVYVNDLPTGAQRLKQKSTGILATIIGGKPAFLNGEHTGALNGRLLRSSPAGVQ
jgi:N-acyl-D-amino-acid deacylase